MKEFDDLKSLLRDERLFEMGVLAGAFENLSKSNKNYKLSIIIFSSVRSPIEIFNEERRRDENSSFDIEIFNDFSIINLSRINKRGRAIKGSFGLFRFKKTNMWVAFTSESPDFFNNGVVSFIESYKPLISRIYLSSEQLRELFEAVETSLSSKITVKKAISYSHIKEGAIRFFVGEDFQELFNDAEANLSYVDAVEFEIIEDNKNQSYHGFISRRSIFYYYSGRTSYFFNHILQAIGSIGIKKIGIFENKERNYENAESKPLRIKFPPNAFASKYDNTRFIKTLEMVSNGAVTIYHNNPYLHISFLDFIDGSNFDIFVVDPDNLTIIPNYKCSMYSLMRVTEEIFKGFCEGEIELAERYAYSLSDYIGE